MGNARIYSIDPFKDFVEYEAADIDDDIDLNALGGKSAAEIRVITAGTGTLVVRLRGKTTNSTFTGLVDGERLAYFVDEIINSGTDVDKIRVSWP